MPIGRPAPYCFTPERGTHKNEHVMPHLLPLALLSLVLLTSCTSGKGFTSVSTDQFQHLIQKEKVQLLDVRTSEEHSAGCIPGSLHIDVLQQAEFLSKADSLLSKKRPVALYCRSGKRSKIAATLLEKAGYKVFELDGGFNAWKVAGH